MFTWLLIASFILFHLVMTCKELMCKHLLATRLADAIEAYDIEMITDSQMIDLLAGNKQSEDDDEVQLE